MVTGREKASASSAKAHESVALRWREAASGVHSKNPRFVEVGLINGRENRIVVRRRAVACGDFDIGPGAGELLREEREATDVPIVLDERHRRLQQDADRSHRFLPGVPRAAGRWAGS